MADHRPTRAHIHLDRLIANYRTAQDLAAGSTVMSILKADAYGHGLTIAAHALHAVGCRWYGVATLDEAVTLREAGITGDILLMGPLFPGDEAEAIREGIACCVFDADMARRLHEAALRLNERMTVHLKVDTGMSRLGFELNGFSAFSRSLAGLDGLHVRGVFTHLAEADRPDGVVTDEQYSLLGAARDILIREQGEISHVHAMNSAALLQGKQPFGDLVRPGLMLYGAYPSPEQRQLVSLEPVMELTSCITQIRRLPAGRKVGYAGTWTAPRDTVLGVVPAGYGDGVPRLLSNQGYVLVGGRRAPIRGRICMDMFMVDLTDVPDPQAGQAVTLLGRQGEQEITTDDWAAWARTIPYEILCGISPRVPRLYSGMPELKASV